MGLWRFFKRGKLNALTRRTVWLQSGNIDENRCLIFLLTNSKILYIYPVYTSTLQNRSARLNHRIGSFQSARTAALQINRLGLPDHPGNMLLILQGRERSMIPRDV
jgi:hypothetical protein